MSEFPAEPGPEMSQELAEQLAKLSGYLLYHADRWIDANAAGRIPPVQREIGEPSIDANATRTVRGDEVQMVVGLVIEPPIEWVADIKGGMMYHVAYDDNGKPLLNDKGELQASEKARMRDDVRVLVNVDVAGERYFGYPTEPAVGAQFEIKYLLGPPKTPGADVQE